MGHNSPMQQQDRDRRGAPTLGRWIASGLLVYGAVGIAVQLRLVGGLLAGLTALGGSLDFHAAPVAVPGLDGLAAHYDAAPALPWLAWLAGLLLWRRSTSPPLSPDPAPAPPAAKSRRPWDMSRILLIVGPLVILLLLGGWARVNQLVPADTGISDRPYDDEGVYAGTSQLWLQGIWPYRDYFFAHPPLAALAYAPAMAYHYTPWGSPTSFMDARYAAVGYSLAALAAMYAIGWQLGLGVGWGLGADGTSLPGAMLSASLAGFLWAMDGRIVEINRKIMLDQPMILASIAALALYLLAVRRPAGRLTTALLIGAGVLAGASALTKVAGLACFLALTAYAAGRWWAGGGGRVPGAGHPLGGVVGGFLGTALLGVAPFLLAAPDRFLREVVLFQVLRPTDCTTVLNNGDCSAAGRITDLAANLQNGPTTVLAAAGFLVLTAALLRGGSGIRDLGSGVRGQGSGDGKHAALSPLPSALSPQPSALLWRPVVLWGLASVLLFTYSRSFYGHYYMQLAAPLCVLGGGLAWWGDLVAGLRGGRWLARLAPLLLAVPLVGLVGLAGQGVTDPSQDRLFVLVSRYVSDAVPPGATVLATDEQFNFLAARPPSHTATGYLVDSYGHLIALGLGLNTRSWDDLLGAALRGEHADAPYGIMWRPAPQADILDRAQQAALVVVHAGGAPRLTDATLAALRARGVRIDERRYLIVNGGSK